MESVQLVFDYFCERTPRSFVELRDTSVVWNYKYADVEFGRLQVRLFGSPSPGWPSSFNLSGACRRLLLDPRPQDGMLIPIQVGCL